MLHNFTSTKKKKNSCRTFSKLCRRCDGTIQEVDLVEDLRRLYQCQSKIFSTFLSKITKYNRVHLGFDPSVAR